MTNKEALIELNSIDSEAYAYMSDRQCAAIDIAIKALSEREQIRFNVYALNEILKEANND